MAHHSNYWSCSKFADWIRGTAKLKAATGKQWNDWHKQAKEAHPIRYWIAEEGLDWIQDAVTWPTRKLYDVKYYINNRWVTKTHSLTSTLQRGKWHEFDTRLLHCMFDELVNYVEIEEAWSHIAWSDEARKKYDAPFYAWGVFRWRTWRSPAAGIDKLKWASDLTNEEFLDEDQKHLAEPTSQALAAREILELYDWWKNVRPARVDPHESSGWSALCERQRKSGNIFADFEDRNDEDRVESNRILDLCHKIESDYYKEDEEMMIRLIRIRNKLWT